MNSLTLLELLRRRSALPVEETTRLLDELPLLLDHAERQGDLPITPLLGAVRVVFAKTVEGHNASRSVCDWPAFHLELISNATQSETAERFNQMAGYLLHDLPARFAGVLYELLGGPHRDDGVRPPLAALSEAANRVLQRAVTGGAHATCAEFWCEFLRESAGAPQVARIPSWLLGSGTRGSTLRLIPSDASVAIHFISRTQFYVGRSVAEADLITRLQPTTPQNEHGTHQLGRVHLVGEVIDGQPTLRDGNGREPSENGSTFDGRPLAHDRATPIRRRGELTLAGHYALEVIHHFAPMPDVVIENLAAWRGGRPENPPEVRGAIAFVRSDGEPMLRDAVWLFTRVDFTLGQANRPIWLSPARNNPAAFLRLGGCFWLLNSTAREETLCIDSRPITIGEAAPLAIGQSLRVGEREFRVEVV